MAGEEGKGEEENETARRIHDYEQQIRALEVKKRTDPHHSVINKEINDLWDKIDRLREE